MPIEAIRIQTKHDFADGYALFSSVRTASEIDGKLWPGERKCPLARTNDLANQ